MPNFFLFLFFLGGLRGLLGGPIRDDYALSESTWEFPEIRGHNIDPKAARILLQGRPQEMDALTISRNSHVCLPLQLRNFQASERCEMYSGYLMGTPGSLKQLVLHGTSVALDSKEFPMDP